MKKANKKISKLLKLTLLLCMVFSQLASPIKTLAEEIVPEYNLNFEFIDEEVGNDNDKYIIKSDGTKILVEDESYILEIVRSFKYEDGNLNENENKYTYSLVLGSVLTNGLDITTEYSIKHETFTYNGTSYINVNVYEIKDKTIDFSTYTEEDYQTLLSNPEDKTEKIMESSFEETVDYNETALDFVVEGEPTYVVCDNTEGYKCTVTKNDINSLVKVGYTTKNGNLNPNETYHTLLKVNGVVADLITEDISLNLGELELDFSKLLPGLYNIEFLVVDKDNNVKVANTVEFNYVSSVEEEIDKVKFIEDAVLNSATPDPEIFYSYTILTDEEKATLGNEYRFLDTPLAFIFDSFVLSNDTDILTNYNLFDEEGRYHVVTSENFLGAFEEDGLVTAYKASDVKSLLTFDMPFTTIEIVDSEGNIVADNSYIQNGMKLVVTILGEELVYDFLVYADVDGGYVENSDLSTLINKVLNDDLSFYDTYNLDLNGDGLINVADISILGFNLYNKNYGFNEFVTSDVLVPVIESDKEELYIDETFEVLVSFEGFEQDYINAIEGFIEYDNDGLRLDKVECLNESFVGNYLNNRFIYSSTETFSTDEDFIKLTFTGLKEGEYQVSLVNMNLFADGVAVVTNDSNTLTIKVNKVLSSDATLKSLTSSVGYFDKAFNSEVYEYTLYVDSSVNYVTLNGELNDEFATTDGFKTYTLYGGMTPINVKVTAEDGTEVTYRVNVVKIYKSSNNNLSDIIIEGYEINFDKNVLEYEIKVGSDVSSLNISALVEHYGAWAKIEGNENFKEGENVVTITVYAEDGSLKTYKLLVNKEKAKSVAVEEEEKEEPQNLDSEKIVIIILIILVVIGLLYLIFKKEDDEEIRVEQIKPKKEEASKSEEQNKVNQNRNKKKNKK